MRAIYFPFTTIPEPVLGALLTCFKQVAVYQPSRSHVPESLRKWEAEGRLRLHSPDVDENDPLPHLIKAYRAWAELHTGERPDFEKFRPPVTPYTNASATSRIRSDIRRAAEGIETTPFQEDKERSRLLMARLYLTMAQEHDQLREALRKDLNRIEGMEKELFRNLIPDWNESIPIRSLNPPVEAIENEGFLGVPRLTAWAHLHVHYREKTNAEPAPMPGMPDVLVTSDRFALNQLLDQADGADKMCDIENIPFGPPTDVLEDVFFNEQRCEKLERLIAEPARTAGWNDFFFDTGGEHIDSGRLTLYRVKGDILTSLLSKSGNRLEPSRLRQDTSEKHDTLAGGIIQKGTF